LGYINLPPSLQSLFAKINERLAKLETSKRFTMPSTTTDFNSTTGRNGDIWLNTSSNTPKYLDATGTVATFGGGGGTVVETPRFKSGYYYSYLGADGSGSTIASASLNVLYLQPFYVGDNATATKIAVYVTTLAAGGVMRLGIYNNSATEDYPNTLLLDAGTVSTATVGSKVITINQTLTQGLYWLAYLSTTGAPSLIGFNNVTGAAGGGGAAPNTTMMPTSTIAGFSGGANALAWTLSGQTSLPATFTGTTLFNSNTASMWLGF